MSASPHDRKKFGDYVRIHAVEGELITREDEAKVLKEGITQFGLELNEARGILLGVAADHDIALVSNAEQQVATMLEHVVRKNKISRKVFGDAVAIYRQLTRNRISESEMNRRVKQMVDTLRPVFIWDRLYLGGGNSRNIRPEVLQSLGDDVIIVSNTAALVGGVRAWQMASDYV